MKKTVVFILLILMLIPFTSCGYLSVIEKNGYELVKVEGGYAIGELSEEAKKQDIYEIPSRIGKYKIVQLGSDKKDGYFGFEIFNLEFGDIRKLIIPKNIKRIDKPIDTPKLIETELPISNISGLLENTYNEHFFISPKENLDVNYIDNEICSDGLIMEEKNDGNIKILYGYKNNITITDEYGGKIIDEIGDNAFKNSNNITLSNNIKIIGENAFKYSNNINIYNDNNIIEIKKNGFAFSNISMFNFNKCELIADEAFSYTNIDNVILPQTLKCIGAGAFRGIKTLKNLTMLESQVTEIPEFCFDLSDLSGEIILPNNILAIGENAFMQTRMKKISIPSSVELIETGAFVNNYLLEEITFPNNFVSVEFDFIGGCDKLVTLNLGGVSNFVITKSYNAGFDSLKTITVSESNQYLYVENGILYNQYNSIVRCPAQLEISEVTINNIPYDYAFYNNKYIKKVKVNSIGLSDGLFDGCSRLTDVELNSNIKEIPFACFRNCENLENINLDNIELFRTQAMAFNSKIKELHLNCNGIENGGFQGCALEKVYFSKTVGLGPRAFCDNINLYVCDVSNAYYDDSTFFNTPLYDENFNKN